MNRFLLILLFLTLSFTTSAETKYPSHYKFGKYSIYVSQNPNEPITYGTYSISVLCDLCEPLNQGGLIQSRNGHLEDWWLADVNNDKTPEIIILIRSDGSGEAGQLDIYQLIDEINDANQSKIKKIIKWELPLPPKEYTQGDSGHERYMLTNDGIVLGFPIYKSQDSNSNPTGGYRQLKYSYIKSEWSILNTNKPAF